MAFSYSSIKTFDQCARKYHRTRVLKNVTDEAGPEADYGTRVHKAAEDYVRDDVPIPREYSYIEPVVSTLKALPGDKHCELKFGVALTDTGFAACDFFGANAWLRGITDLLVVNGTKGVLVDYKTGKNAKYADVKQLDLMAGAAFVLFPQLEEIKSGLLFLVSNDLIKKTHTVDKTNAYLKVFRHELARLDDAHERDMWPPSPSPLCGWCPVKDCEFWTKPKKRG